jgi:hypothetical protein
MDWTCPTCGKAFKRTRQAHKCFSAGTPEHGFPGDKGKWLPLYFTLLSSVQDKVPFDCEYAPSGGAQWRKRSIFASMHGEKAGLYVNFFSSQQLSSIHPLLVFVHSANRLMHVVCISDTEQVPELAGCILASYVLTEQAGPAKRND